MDITIRQASPKDAHAVFPLAASLSTTAVVDEAKFTFAFHELITSPSARVLVAERSDTLVGYALGFCHATFYANGPVGWVEEIFVTEECRRLHVGQQLMELLERWTKEQGGALVALATRRASAFYKSIGYEESATYFRKLL